MTELSPQSVYNDNVEALAGIQKSAQEKYDAILTTLGSAFLALSVSFLRDIVPLQEAQSLWLLYLSWVLFALTIVATVLSLGIGPRAVAWQVEKLTPSAYPDPRLPKHNPWNKVIGVLNVLSGASFIIAVLVTVVFVVINTVHWRSEMEKRVPPPSETKGLTMPPLKTGTPQPANTPAGGGSTTPASGPAQQNTNGAK